MEPPPRQETADVRTTAVAPPDRDRRDQPLLRCRGRHVDRPHHDAPPRDLRRGAGGWAPGPRRGLRHRARPRLAAAPGAGDAAPLTSIATTRVGGWPTP